jgi:hypothetical protein
MAKISGLETSLGSRLAEFIPVDWPVEIYCSWPMRDYESGRCHEHASRKAIAAYQNARIRGDLFVFISTQSERRCAYVKYKRVVEAALGPESLTIRLPALVNGSGVYRFLQDKPEFGGKIWCTLDDACVQISEYVNDWLGSPDRRNVYNVKGYSIPNRLLNRFIEEVRKEDGEAEMAKRSRAGR